MWKTTTVIFVVTVGASHFLGFYGGDVEVPKLPETDWGPKNRKELSSKDIKPFKIDVPKSVIDDLNERLDKTRPFVDPLESTAWSYGISTPSLKKILQYWRTKYNWTERQALLNKYPQFKTNIQGLDIHFYHVKPTNLPKNRNIKVLPLLLVHGWPGSVVEFQKILPMLTTPHPDREFVFEVIAPSLPGYGFSDPAVRPGLAGPQIAGVFKNLMTRLGFNRFYTQGGDWGAVVTLYLGTLYPEHVIGVHSNMCVVDTKASHFWILLGSLVSSFVVDKQYKERMYPLGQHFSRLIEESGYMHIQASKPDTIGVAVSQSPAALAAYILEKFSTWTNEEYKKLPDGGLLDKFTMDELLDNLMIYWVTNSVTTSMRLYAEEFSFANRALDGRNWPLKLPLGCAIFPHELLYQSESVVRTRFGANLIQFNHMPRGGHFAAFEEPALLANDVFEFTSKVEEMSKKEEEEKTRNS